MLFCLQELSNKETQLTHCESSLVVYRRRFAVLRHQQGLLYQEYKEKQEDWEGQAETWDKAKHKFVDQIEQQEAKVQEFNVSFLLNIFFEVRSHFVHFDLACTILVFSQSLVYICTVMPYHL